MTNLPKLYWRIGAAPSRPNNSDKSTAQQQLSTLLTQVQGCRYWQVLADGTAQTPPYIVIGPYQTATANSSQVSTSSNMQVVITTNITGSTAYRTPDTNTANGQYRLQFGMTPNITEGGSGSLSTVQRDRPFQTATGNPRWSGYWHTFATASVSASFIFESLDSIYIGFKDNTSTSGTGGFLVGNIVEAFDSASGENNFRRYGMVTGGATSFNSTFWTNVTSTTAMFSTTNNDGTVHVGTFIVSGGVPNGDTATGVSAKVWEHAVRFHSSTPGYDDYATWHNTALLSGANQVAYPIPMYSQAVSSAAPFKALGILRGVFMTSDDRGGLVRIQSNSLDQVYKVTATFNQTTNDAFLLGPASGALFL